MSRFPRRPSAARARPGRTLAALVCAATAWAAAPRASALDPAVGLSQYGRDAWTTVQGLPQSTVTAVAQTPDGYLWLGTHDGLVRFDGVAFTVYTPKTAPGLLGRHITALRGAADGSLWVGTDGKGLTRYRRGAFETLGPDPQLTGTSGNSLYVDPSGTLWAGTWTGALSYAGGRATWYRVAQGLPHDAVFAVAGDGRGLVLVATGQGIVQVRDGRVQPYPAAAGILEPQCLLVDRRGVVWVGSASGLDRIENGRRRSITTADGLLANFVSAILEDRDGGVWIATEAGLNRWTAGRIESFTSAEGLPGDAVTSLFEDREGNVWAGLRGSGLVRFRDGEVATYGRRSGLSENDVTCIFQSSDGSMWFGTTRGLTRWKDGEYRVFTRRDGLLNDSITGLGEDPSLGVLVGTYDKRVNVVRDGRVGVLPGLLIDSTVVSAFARGADGALWVGTRGAGVYRVRDGRAEHFAFANSSGRYVIYDIAVDSRGVAWFATPNGLLRHEKDAFSFVDVYDQHENRGVAFGLHVARDGAVWVATRDRGVCRVADGGGSRCFGEAEGLPSDTVFGVLEDDASRLYLGTPHGVAVVGRKDLEALAPGEPVRPPALLLGVEHGMATAETQGLHAPSAWRAADGRLWFATVRGAVAVDPRRVGAPPPPPPVLLESVSVDGRSFAAGGPVSAGPGRGAIDIRYTALAFRAPETIRFRYRLEGFDPDWIDAGARRVARYTNIPPGSYSFRVTAAQGDGPWNEGAAVVALSIAPHFYQTRWWAALVVLFAVALGALAVSWRVRTLRRRTVELQEKVAEAVANVKVLSGLLPICSSCKRIRSDEGYWHQIEAYIREHSEADFTHGVCPECMVKLFPNVADKVLARRRGERGALSPGGKGPEGPTAG
ncbi:MAG: two-component regulator propeller domain-containing protein [Vicinamibacteria bacterium]